MNEVDEVKNLMLAHDWFHEYADDMKDWRAGAQEKQVILLKMKKLSIAEKTTLIPLIPSELKESWLKAMYLKEPSVAPEPSIPATESIK